MRDGRGELLLVHRAVTDNDNLVEHLSILLHHHINLGAAINSDILSGAADIGETQR